MLKSIVRLVLAIGAAYVTFAGALVMGGEIPGAKIENFWGKPHIKVLGAFPEVDAAITSCEPDYSLDAAEFIESRKLFPGFRLRPSLGKVETKKYVAGYETFPISDGCGVFFEGRFVGQMVMLGTDKTLTDVVAAIKKRFAITNPKEVVRHWQYTTSKYIVLQTKKTIILIFETERAGQKQRSLTLFKRVRK